ncbi:MAG: hypothetical protein OEZ43_21970, partial [Gammaproteobacteria bacterium]|nr:hypothetical protein [Gammaproteobacteria bacterium]
MTDEQDIDVEYGESSEVVTPGEQSIADLTVQDYMARPPLGGREPYMVTRFPVDMNTYRQMSHDAQQLDQAPTDPEAKVDSPSDEDVEPKLTDAGKMSMPEDTLFPGEFGPTTLAPPVGNSFAGTRATGWQPPDNCIGVGPNDVLLGVNVDLAGYQKTGALRFRWPNMSTLFSVVLPTGIGIFDPRIIYDHYASRWCVVAAGRGSNPNRSYLMIGVSQTTDPAGRWWVYRLDATRDGSNATNNWADYPMLGFDTQCFYIVSNMFQFGGGFQYSKLRILYKSQLYNGQGVTWYDFWNLKNPNGSKAFTVQPCCHYQGLGGNPPAYMVNALWPNGNTLTFWTINNPAGHWTGGSAPSLSKANVPCRSYDLPPDALQQGTPTRIETNDSRLLNAVFQYVGNTRRVWTCHTSKISWSG